jgi:C1A family cysteine protease
MLKHKFSLGLGLLCSITMVSWGKAKSPNSAEINVQALNLHLSKVKAEWVAKENWLTALPKSDLKRMMGLSNLPATDVEFVTGDENQVGDEEATLRPPMPAVLDWRNKDGRNWVSPMLNQANCGSCVAFAAIGVMETQLNISSVLPDLNIRLSPQNLFSCGGGYCSYGWQPTTAASRLMVAGVPDEACMPYTSGATSQDVSCKASCQDTAQRSRKISDYKRPTRFFKNIEAVKRALQKGPVMTTLTVYADFIAYAGGVYKHTTGEALGGHAVSIIGYDDVEQAFIIRNSWGEDWGEKGFGRVSYKDRSGVGKDTISFEIPAMGGAVSILNPRDYNYITNEMEFRAQSTYPSTDSIALSVRGSNDQVVWGASCKPGEKSVTCSSTFESLDFNDGRYEIEALALNSRGERLGVSARQLFYVVNEKPELKLSFQGLENSDLEKDLTGRIEFDISTSTSSVPMSSMDFYFKSLESGEVKSRLVEVVLPRMTMGWRTPAIANGRYEIWFAGHIKSNGMNVTVDSPHKIITIKN